MTKRKYSKSDISEELHQLVNKLKRAMRTQFFDSLLTDLQHIVRLLCLYLHSESNVK